MWCDVPIFIWSRAAPSGPVTHPGPRFRVWFSLFALKYFHLLSYCMNFLLLSSHDLHPAQKHWYKLWKINPQACRCENIFNKNYVFLQSESQPQPLPLPPPESSPSAPPPPSQTEVRKVSCFPGAEEVGSLAPAHTFSQFPSPFICFFFSFLLWGLSVERMWSSLNAGNVITEMLPCVWESASVLLCEG